MEIFHAVDVMQAAVRRAGAHGRRVALVPTMGNLHRGHLALVEEARRMAEYVTVSIFVNPTQFGPGEDFDAYPRTLAQDKAALHAVGGVDAIFAPSVEALYPQGPGAQRTWVDVADLTEHLCGAHRPGHFEGVATVVTKLFHACRPNVAVFGLKDAQQFFVLRRMERDLNFGIDLVGVPTVREPDGLALSSRNQYLSPAEREQATVLHRALEVARSRVAEGEQQVGPLVEAMLDLIEAAPAARVQYAEVVDTSLLQPLHDIRPGQEVLIALAVYIGTTRLIDNVILRAPLSA